MQALVPVDQLGNALRAIDVTPPTARVVIPVFSDRQSRTLPVNPVITGTPAAIRIWFVYELGTS